MYFPDLIEEYKQSLKELKAAGGCPSMERDMQEAIQWMETGYDPAEYRAATRTDAYVMDHHLMQDLITYVDSPNEMPEYLENVENMLYHKYHGDQLVERFGWRLYDEAKRIKNNKTRINNALEGLTENERFAFIAIRAEQMTFAKVAKTMGVTRGTVQNYVKRAETKIDINVGKVKKFLFAV